MPSFRQHPLTWLFLIATACVDAVALATDHESAWANALVLGQLLAVSGWLVVGKSHRLARAGVTVAAVGLLTAPDFFVGRRRGDMYADLVWPHVQGLLITTSAATAALTWAWLALAQSGGRGRARSAAALAVSTGRDLWMDDRRGNCGGRRAAGRV